MKTLSRDIFQVLIVSKDVEKTARALADLFGCDVPPAVILDPESIAHAKYRGRPTKTRAKVIPFYNPGGVDVEIIQPDGEPSIWRELLEKEGEGIGHIGIMVDDMAEAVEFMKAKGYPVAHQASFTGGCYTIFDTKKRLGVNVMLKYMEKG
jgi:methylmalonyl-CoA/ethylmalonyl-CoA epimerase